MAAGASSGIVTTNAVAPSSAMVICVLQAVDATLTAVKACVPATERFTYYGNAAATEAVRVAFLVLN